MSSQRSGSDVCPHTSKAFQEYILNNLWHEYKLTAKNWAFLLVHKYLPLFSVFWYDTKSSVWSLGHNLIPGHSFRLISPYAQAH